MTGHVIPAHLRSVHNMAIHDLGNVSSLDAVVPFLQTHGVTEPEPYLLGSSRDLILSVLKLAYFS